MYNTAHDVPMEENDEELVIDFGKCGYMTDYYYVPDPVPLEDEYLEEGEYYSYHQPVSDQYDTPQQNFYEPPVQQETKKAGYRIKRVFLMFANYERLKSTRMWKNWLNWLIYKVNGTLVHVEPLFLIETPQGEEEWHSFNVIAFSHVDFSVNKDYDWIDDRWKTYAISASPDEMITMYNFCKAQIGKKFNTNGLTNYILPSFLTYRSNGETWTCSQLTITMLQQCFKQLDEHDRDKVSVSKLLDLCENGELFVLDVRDHDKFVNSLSVV